MASIYLLVTLISQFSPQNIMQGGVFSLAPAGPEKVSVEFEELSGIQIKSPVVAAGDVVGFVSKISVVAGENPEAEARSFQVEVELLPEHRSHILHGTVGLLSTLSSNNTNVDGEARSRTVIELMLPPTNFGRSLETGARIVGYTSYEKFWSADLGKAGIEEDLFQVG